MPGSALSDARELSRLWNGVLGSLRFEVEEYQYDAWLKGTSALVLDGNLLTIEAKTQFVCDWLHEHLSAPASALVSTRRGAATVVRFRPRQLASLTSVLTAPEPAAATQLAGIVNPDLAFETYVVGETNQSAYRTAVDLTSDTPWPLGPVVLWGHPGLGKTHLLHAAAGRALSAGWQVTCLAAHEFMDRYMDAYRLGRLADFQREVRRSRLLAIDDLQYLAGRRGALEDLQHAVDAVEHAGGRVIVAAERHPLDLDMPATLAGRLAGGVVVRMQPLGREERRRFAERTAARAGVDLPIWALERATAFEASCVRILRGAVNAAIVLHRAEQLDPGRLDAELSRVVLRAARPGAMSDAQLLEAVAKHFGMDADTLRGPDRTKATARARAAAAAALNGRGRSVAAVAALLGRKKGTVSGILAGGRETVAADAALSALLAG